MIDTALIVAVYSKNWQVSRGTKPQLGIIIEAVVFNVIKNLNPGSITENMSMSFMVMYGNTFADFVMKSLTAKRVKKDRAEVYIGPKSSSCDM